MRTILRKMVCLAICLTISLSTIAISLAQPDLQNRTQTTVGTGDVKSGINEIGSTSFEELKSIGFDSQQRRIDASIDIKQPYGYNGFEFVSFYIDWNNNGIFENNELVGTSNVYISNSGDNIRPFLPISYSVSSNIEKPDYRSWYILKAMAILSFNDPPTSPNYVPTYGNIINSRIRNPYFWIYYYASATTNTDGKKTDSVSER